MYLRCVEVDYTMVAAVSSQHHLLTIDRTARFTADIISCLSDSTAITWSKCRRFYNIDVPRNRDLTENDRPI